MDNKPATEFLKRQINSWQLMRLDRDYYGFYLFGYGLRFKPDFESPWDSALELREVMGELGGRAFDPFGIPKESLYAPKILKEARELAAKKSPTKDPESVLIKEVRASGVPIQQEDLELVRMKVSYLTRKNPLLSPPDPSEIRLIYWVLEDVAASSVAKEESPVWSVASIVPKQEPLMRALRAHAFSVHQSLGHPRILGTHPDGSEIAMTQIAYKNEIEQFLEGCLVFIFNPKALKKISPDLFKAIESNLESK